jgi:hypothetical protein
MIKKALLGAALAASLFALSTPASATLTNWYIDTDGAGGNAAVLVSDFLDLTGSAYVHNTFTGATTFNFNEAGRFNVFSADTSTILSPFLTATFTGTGSGTTGGLLSFNTDGLLNVFSGLNNIGTFNLQVGTANLIANSTLPNGTVSLIFKASAMDAGYFFDSNMVDLSIAANSPTGVVLGFATTNAIALAGNVTAGLITDYNAAFNPDAPAVVTPNGITDLHISNNGQFRFDVPEPSMLSLMGLALVGFAYTTRRKSKA